MYTYRYCGRPNHLQSPTIQILERFRPGFSVAFALVLVNPSPESGRIGFQTDPAWADWEGWGPMDARICSVHVGRAPSTTGFQGSVMLGRAGSERFVDPTQTLRKDVQVS